MKRGPIGLGLVAVMTATGLTAVPPTARGDDGLSLTMYKTEFRPDGTEVRTRVEVAGESRPATDETKPEEPAAPAPGKLDPGLAAEAAENPSARKPVIITFEDEGDVEVPRFPDPDATLPRDAPANVRVQEQADGIVAQLTAQRQPGYRALTAELASLDVRPLGTYWLVKAMEVDAPLSALPTLAERGDVAYIEPVETDDRPPADSDPANDEEDARALMGTDRYFSSRGSAYIGILDTGVRSSHVLFNNPGKPWIREDLTGKSNPADDCWNHGTRTASIITGNNNLGPAFRGVTGITMDSFKVYPAGCGALNTAAAVRGFQRAVQVGDRVIVAEMQGKGNEKSAISTAADKAFDAGAMVIAANGNNGPGSGTVNVPGVAQKSLGIGAVDVKTQVTPGYQSLGPAHDGRIKPDLQAPTHVETGSANSDTATQVFGGTSAATANAGGAAGLARELWRGSGFELDPGYVYAYMLATGSLPDSPNNQSGAGLIRLPASGWAWTGRRTVGHRQVLEYPFPIGGVDVGRRVSMAIWWPEKPDKHNDIDIALVDPNGIVRASGLSVNGVFERASFGPLTAGNWKIRITGYRVPSGPQKVYWSGTMTP